ncbi:hypothetical protein L1887_49539 [Cichorium endivia]|nr:hypothetical protein L1887_49539 [Cichorium endivia]
MRISKVINRTGAPELFASRMANDSAVCAGLGRRRVYPVVVRVAVESGQQAGSEHVDVVGAVYAGFEDGDGDGGDLGEAGGEDETCCAAAADDLGNSLGCAIELRSSLAMGDSHSPASPHRCQTTPRQHRAARAPRAPSSTPEYSSGDHTAAAGPAGRTSRGRFRTAGREPVDAGRDELVGLLGGGEDALELCGVGDAVFAAVDAAGLGFGDDAARVAVGRQLGGEAQSVCEGKRGREGNITHNAIKPPQVRRSLDHLRTLAVVHVHGDGDFGIAGGFGGGVQQQAVGVLDGPGEELQDDGRVLGLGGAHAGDDALEVVQGTWRGTAQPPAAAASTMALARCGGWVAKCRKAGEWHCEVTSATEVGEDVSGPHSPDVARGLYLMFVLVEQIDDGRSVACLGASGDLGLSQKLLQCIQRGDGVCERRLQRCTCVASGSGFDSRGGRAHFTQRARHMTEPLEHGLQHARPFFSVKSATGDASPPVVSLRRCPHLA